MSEAALGHLHPQTANIYLNLGSNCSAMGDYDKALDYTNDAIEIYAFNGTKLELVQKRDYEKTFRNEDFIRSESEAMVRNYVEGILKIHRTTMPAEELTEKAKALVDSCFKSFLDSDFNIRITKILPQLGE